MPIFDIPKSYNDGDDLLESMLDSSFEYIEGALNTTKLDSTNLQSGAVVEATLAANAVSTSKLQANAVTLAKLASEIADKLVPVGTVHAYGGASAPSGYLLCDGSAVSRASYSALFAVLGVSNGSGDGLTTFNIPDYRGRFLRGRDAGAGRDLDAASRTAMNPGGATGDALGSVQTSATKMPNTPFAVAADGAHSHTLPPANETGGGGSNVSNSVNGGSGSITTSTASAHTHALTGGDLETRPINAAVNFIIKT